MDAAQLRKRFDALKGERTTIENQYAQVERYVRPGTGAFYQSNTNEGSNNFSSVDVYDSTAIIASQQLAASIQTSLTPPLLKWLNLAFQDSDLNDSQPANEWLQDSGDKCWMALTDSDFSNEMSKAYLDLVTYGIAFILLEEDAGGLQFTTAPVKNSYFESGRNGQPRAYYRELQLTPGEALDLFGDDTPQHVMELQNSGRVTDRSDFIFCTWLNDDYVSMDGPVAPAMRQWLYCHVDMKLNEYVGDVGGYYERPIFAPKWLEASDSKFGLSPAMRALPDIGVANEVTRMILAAAEKSVDPPLWCEESGLFGDLDIRAGGLTMVRSKDSFGVLDLGGRFDVGNMQLDAVKAQIRQAFYSDDLNLKDSPQMTATETMARMELMQRTLGSTFGYLKSYLLDPLVQRTFNILLRGGKLEEPPKIVKEYWNEANLDIQYLGTLARSQKRDEVDTITGFLSDIATLGEIFPQALEIPDVDAMVRAAAEARNLPASMLKSIDEVRAEQKARAEQEQAREQLEQDQIASQTVSNISQARQ